jgi:AraC family transcriptional regulator
MKESRIDPEIKVLKGKKLVGKKLTVSYSHYNVSDLWKSFMPRRKEIMNNVNSDLISMAVYGPSFFRDFSTENIFEKWAAVEVTDFDSIPEKMDKYRLEEGLYAVFNYKGPARDTSVFKYIFEKWLPASEFILDDRPHFEILGEKYKNDDPDSEEEIWIPVRIR